jgi:hypothetical protein
VSDLLRRYPRLTKAALLLAAAYSVMHVIVSGVLQPLRVPAIGQVVEELQPLYRLFTTGAATVDHPRQYGPVFLMIFHPVYRFTLSRPDVLAWYGYAVDVAAIVIAFLATRRAIRRWAAMRAIELPPMTTPALLLLWANFSPLYGVLAVKNVELWELALIAVAGAALLEERRWIAGWAIAAAALTKMLPLVFFPYLLLRDRRAFAHALVASAAILVASHLLYGDQMGFGYAPMVARAALGGEGYGNAGVWHENVSLRGLAFKAFGYLEQPGSRVAAYQLGYYVIVPPSLHAVAQAVALIVEALAIVWMLWQFARHRSWGVFERVYWEWALVAIMMLLLAPQVSQDYMVLALGAFSCILAACLVRNETALWVRFGLAVLFVGNVIPRGLLARLIGVGAASRFAGHEHLTPAEAYQYFGFPLLGMLILLSVWVTVSGQSDTAGALRRPTSD